MPGQSASPEATGQYPLPPVQGPTSPPRNPLAAPQWQPGATEQPTYGLQTASPALTLPALGPYFDPEQGSPRRSFSPDLARGFMLCLIAVANVTAYLWGTANLDDANITNHASGSITDNILATLAILFVDGRIFPMFAFLFGYGMVQFARARTSAGDEPRGINGKLLRRNFSLILFGFIHALLLFGGDILGTYGLAGLVLGYAVLHGSDRALKITAWILAGIIALFAVIQFGLGMLFIWIASTGSGSAEYDGTGYEEAAAASDSPELGFLNTLVTMGNDENNYFLAMLARVLFWIVGIFMANLTLFIPLCVILGGLAARHWWIEVRPQSTAGDGQNSTPTRRKPSLGLVAGVGITLGVLGAVPNALSFFGLLDPEVLPPFAFVGVNQITGVAAGIGYVALFGLIGMRWQERPPAFLRPIAYLGKRSLSFYLFQSVIFALLLAAWGLGLGETWTTTPAFLLAIGVWIVSVLLAWVMEKKNHKGPAEVVLRRLTYGRR